MIQPDCLVIVTPAALSQKMLDAILPPPMQCPFQFLKYWAEFDKWTQTKMLRILFLIAIEQPCLL